MRSLPSIWPSVKLPNFGNLFFFFCLSYRATFFFFQIFLFFFPRKTGKAAKTGNFSKAWKFNRGQGFAFQYLEKKKGKYGTTKYAGGKKNWKNRQKFFDKNGLHQTPESNLSCFNDIRTGNAGTHNTQQPNKWKPIFAGADGEATYNTAYGEAIYMQYSRSITILWLAEHRISRCCYIIPL